jgi:hypothetical protein
LLALTFQLLTARSVGTRRVLPGAVCAALAWQVLQILGTYYFGHTLRDSSATYGLFGVVLGLLVWLYLSALAVVLGAEINAVREGRLWPRSLLTPFTDDVQLTHGDRRAYRMYAQTERHKGFQTVKVEFDQEPPEGPPPPERRHRQEAQDQLHRAEAQDQLHRAEAQDQLHRAEAQDQLHRAEAQDQPVRAEAPEDGREGDARAELPRGS